VVIGRPLANPIWPFMARAQHCPACAGPPGR